jgi:hypothetical protein
MVFVERVNEYQITAKFIKGVGAKVNLQSIE